MFGEVLQMASDSQLTVLSQIAPLLTANPFTDLSFRKQYAKCIHS